MLKAVSTKKPADLIVRVGDKSFVFLRVPKVASTAMSYYLNSKGAKALGREEALKHPDRVAFLRHPVERLKSAYRFGWVKRNMQVLPFDLWWQEVRLNPSFDVHTMPQSVILQSHATETYQLEEIGLWWGALAAKYPFALDAREPARANESPSEAVSVPDDVYAEIMEIYAEDYTRWLEASVSGLPAAWRRDPVSRAQSEPPATDEPPATPPVRVTPVGTTQRIPK